MRAIPKNPAYSVTREDDGHVVIRRHAKDKYILLFRIMPSEAVTVMGIRWELDSWRHPVWDRLPEYVQDEAVRLVRFKKAEPLIPMHAR